MSGDAQVGLAKAKQMSSGSLDEIRQKVVERLSILLGCIHRLLFQHASRLRRVGFVDDPRFSPRSIFVEKTLHLVRYLKQYGKKELVEVCELLDRELMKHFRYTDCESVLDGR